MTRYEIVCGALWKSGDPHYVRSFAKLEDALAYCKERAQNYESGLLVIEATYNPRYVVENTVTSNVKAL